MTLAHISFPIAAFTLLSHLSDLHATYYAGHLCLAEVVPAAQNGGVLC